MDFMGDKCTDKRFDEYGLPRFSEENKTPNQLLIYEVNGKFVHECLPVQPDEIKTFKAINQDNPNDIERVQRLSYFSGKLKDLNTRPNTRPNTFLSR